MSVRNSPCWLALSLCATLAYAAETKSWSTRCVALNLSGQNASAQCAPGLDFSQPSPAELKQGTLPSLTFKTRHPQFPSLRFEFRKASFAGAAVDLEIARMNGADTPPGMNCRFLPNSLNAAAVGVTCTSPLAILAHVLTIDEPSAKAFFNQAIAMHDLLSPTSPFPRPASPTQPAAPARSVAIHSLEGQCKLLRFNALNLTQSCNPPVTLQVPNRVAAGQGESPRLFIPVLPGAPSVWLYLSNPQPATDGTVRWTVTGVNSTQADANSVCAVSPAEILCRGTAGGPSGLFALNFTLTSDPAAIAALRVGSKPPTNAAPAPSAKTVLSTDPKAIFGMMVGTQRPAIPFCPTDYNTPMPADMPLCRSEAGAQFAGLLGTLKSEPNVIDHEKMGLTMLAVFVNRQVFDTKFTDNVLVYVDAANVIQRIKVSTTMASDRDVMSMLTMKFGQPGKQTLTTWTSPQGGVVSRTPNYFWSFPNVLVDYYSRDTTILNKLSTAGGIDVYTPAYVRLADEYQKRRGAPPPGKRPI
jgi:hypothetical protein